MNLRHLSYLTALAKERNFGRAARACHITQPSLSAALLQLEEELGVPLVLRSRQRFEGFTPEGARALQWAQQILADVDSLTQSLSSARGQLVGHLHIGIIPTAEPMAGRLCAQFHAQHPGVRVTWLSLTAKEIATGMSEHRLDAGISYADEIGFASLGTQFAFLPLYTEGYAVLGSERWIGGQVCLTWQQAAQLPLVLLNQEMQNRQLIDRHFMSAGVVPQVIAEASTLVGVLSQVRTGLQCAIVPQQFADLIGVTADLVAVPLSTPELTATIGLVTLRRMPQAPCAAALHAALSAADFGSPPKL